MQTPDCISSMKLLFMKLFSLKTYFSLLKFTRVGTQSNKIYEKKNVFPQFPLFIQNIPYVVVRMNDESIVVQCR